VSERRAEGRSRLASRLARPPHGDGSILDDREQAGRLPASRPPAGRPAVFLTLSNARGSSIGTPRLS
jgi:hypothetical protein